MPLDLTCLRSIANEASKDLKNNEVTVNEKIENYKLFYSYHGVPEGKIFLSGIVSAQKILELCQNVDFLVIHLAKNSSDKENFHDFTFVISQCDTEAKIIPDEKHFGLQLVHFLDFNGVADFSPQYIDSTCCRNPPGS